MLVDLKLDPPYDGFVMLAESRRHPPLLQSHRHKELELNLLAQGTVTYVVDGRRFDFNRGSLMWFFPDQEHHLVHRTPDAQYYVAVFMPSMIRAACRDARYAGLLDPDTHGEGVLHTMVEPARFDLLRELMNSMLESSLDPDILNREAGYGENSDFRYRHGDPDSLNAGLRYLLLLAWRAQLAGKPSGSSMKLHPSVSRALELLENADEDLPLEALSRKCGVSSAHLSRMFGKQVGMSLSSYRNNLRLRRFWEAHRAEKATTITEAVFEAGFGSYAQFHKVFRRRYGCSPRESMR